MEVCGPVAYRVRLPPQLSAIHDIFHISQLKKCVRVPTEIIEQQESWWNQISLMLNILSKSLIKRREVLDKK